MAREVIRCVQSARKAAGLNVDDRIKLVLDSTDDELKQAINEYSRTIAQETLANSLALSCDADYQTAVNVEGKELIIKLAKS